MDRWGHGTLRRVDRAALEQALRVASRAADRARAEIMPRFRVVEVEHKADGSPVTEADRAAERAIRTVLREAYPKFGILGEEFGAEHCETGPRWVIDPIDGTIAYSRGLPLFATLIALLDGDDPVVGLIDLPTLDERYHGSLGGGCWRGSTRLRVSQQSDLSRALVSHGDPLCFERAGQQEAFDRMARAIPFFRGYTDAFGHSQVLSGAIDAMVDFDLNLWDAAATQLLVAEAGGRCVVRQREGGKLDLVFGSAPLVEKLCAMLTS
ncbi:MAG: inositol monophosphatase family protein [Myxococcota bacterium]